MDVYMIVLRVIHIIAGVFWAGGAFFIVRLVLPSATAAGPEGAKYMQILGGRMAPALGMASGLTILSGLLMYWRVSGGFQSAWITSGVGLGFTLGGLAGLAAIGIGFAVARPASARMAALGKEIQAAGGPPSAAQRAEIQRLQDSLAQGALWTAILLLISLIGMSVARYLFF